MPPPPSRRLLLALAASLGLHALLWLLPEGEQSPAQPLPGATPPLQLVEVDVAPARPPPAPPKPPAPKPPRLRPAPPRPPAPVAPAPDAPPATVSEAPPAPPPEPPTGEGVPVAPTAPDVPGADAPRAGPRPSLSQLLPTPTLTLRPEDPPDAGVSVPEALPPERMVQRLVEDAVSRGKVDRGLVHSYYADLGRALLSTWDAERAVSAQGLAGFLEQARGNTGEWMKVWQERARTFGGSGSPLNSATPDPFDRAPTLDPNLEARRAMVRQMREQFKSSRRATLRVVQDSAGRLLSVELISPSNNAQVDREAVADVRAAAERLPPPPAEAVQGRERLVSLWEFELIVSITPPIPTVSFEFDAALKFFDARLPLDRRIYKRVRLVGVQ